MNEPRGTYFDFLKLGNDSTDAVHPPDIFGGENSQTGERGISRGLQPQRRRGTDEDSDQERRQNADEMEVEGAVGIKREEYEPRTELRRQPQIELLHQEMRRPIQREDGASFASTNKNKASFPRFYPQSQQTRAQPRQEYADSNAASTDEEEKEQKRRERGGTRFQAIREKARRISPRESRPADSFGVAQRETQLLEKQTSQLDQRKTTALNKTKNKLDFILSACRLQAQSRNGNLSPAQLALGASQHQLQFTLVEWEAALYTAGYLTPSKHLLCSKYIRELIESSKLLIPRESTTYVYCSNDWTKEILSNMVLRFGLLEMLKVWLPTSIQNPKFNRDLLITILNSVIYTLQGQRQPPPQLQQDEAPPPQIQIICLPFLTAVLRHMDVIEESAKQVEAKKYLPLKVLAAEELESYFKTNHIAVRVCASLSELQNLRSIYLSNE